MTTLEDMERIALLHVMLAIREHAQRQAATAGPGSPGACTVVGRPAAAADAVRACAVAPALRWRLAAMPTTATTP